MTVERKAGILKMLACFLVTFAVMGVALWFLRFPSIKGESMMPTYEDGDVVLTLHVKSVERGDVAIVWSRDLDEYVVKRVMGLPGDTVEIRDGRFYRNGVLLYETYIMDQDWDDGSEDVSVTLGDGEIFLLGDNRNNSKDSRAFGAFYVEDVFGIVLGR